MGNTYNKAMIELVYEIRRRIDSKYKPSIKLANPDILNELIDYYQDCCDAILKALIKELMVYAGDEWEARLYSGIDNHRTKHTVRVYRGTVSLEEESQAIKKPAKPELIYRGQVIK